MANVTPAELALELGFSQKRVRDVLRERFGTLPDGQTRWEIDEPSADYVRQRLRGETGQLNEWALDVGDEVRRRAIHGAYGGQQQGGISTPRSIPDILIFTDPKTGARYGYDRFEGLREDGSYSYTGEGQFGPQEFVRGNLAIRDSAGSGRILRLFTTNGTMARYIGSFTTGDPTYRMETIPDLDGNPRAGIIFNLIPLDADERLLPAYGGMRALQTAEVEPWYPPDYSDVVIAPTNEGLSGDRVVSRVEFQLQSDFGQWVIARGAKPRRLVLPVGSSSIEPDLYVPDLKWIVEAKKSAGRAYVRTAIGQVLDYVFVASRLNIDARPVILLPGLPDTDLVGLIQSLGIALVVRTESDFEVLEP